MKQNAIERKTHQVMFTIRRSSRLASRLKIRNVAQKTVRGLELSGYVDCCWCHRFWKTNQTSFFNEMTFLLIFILMCMNQQLMQWWIGHSTPNDRSLPDLLIWHLALVLWRSGVSSLMFMVSRRWPRHWADHSSREILHVLVLSKSMWSTVNSLSRQVITL